MIAFRCSELDRVVLCAGSITLTRMVMPRNGDEGLEGSALHLDSATRIVKELGATAPDGLPEWDPEFPSMKFCQWISDFYFRQIRDLTPDGWALEVEVPLAYEFDCTPYKIQNFEHKLFTLSGHIDCLAINGDGTEAIGFDLKTGYAPVDSAEQNWQMRGYIVLLRMAYPQLRKVTFHIVQPRNDEESGFPRISSIVLTTPEAIDEALAGLTSALDKAIANRFNVNTGRIQCKWCSAALQCPATIAERERMKALLTPELLAKIKLETDDATLADWVIAAKSLNRPIEDATDMAAARVKDAGGITASDGTRITHKTTRGTYTIVDRESLWKTVGELLPEQHRIACADWSFSRMKDAFAEHMNIKKGGAGAVTAEKVFDSKIRPFVSQGERNTFIFT